MNITTKLILSGLLLFAPRVYAADARAATDAQASQPNSDKLDVSDLEKKYWAAKDTDFSVVQNRAYSKANRFAIAAMYGPIINDSYSDGFDLNLSGQYFFNERNGVELQYLSSSSHDNSSSSAFVNQYQTKPDFDRVSSYYGVNYNWVPIYAKMSLMNSKILYFDMAFSPGLGITNYNEERINASSPAKSAATASLNVTQHFFLTNHFAIRGEFQNRWYNENVIHQTTGDSVRTQLQHDSALVFGVDVFF